MSEDFRRWNEQMTPFNIVLGAPGNQKAIKRNYQIGLLLNGYVQTTITQDEGEVIDHC